MEKSLPPFEWRLRACSSAKENDLWGVLKHAQSTKGVIFAPRSWQTDLDALGPYAINSSEIFSRPARPKLSQ